MDNRHTQATDESDGMITLTRNPITDPQPGDRLLSAGKRIDVTARYPFSVVYNRDGLPYSLSIIDWQTKYGGKATKILKIAETATPDVIADAVEAVGK